MQKRYRAFVLVVVLVCLLGVLRPRTTSQANSDRVELVGGFLYVDRVDGAAGEREIWGDGNSNAPFLFSKGGSPIGTEIAVTPWDELLQQTGLKRQEVAGLGLWPLPALYRMANILCRFPEDPVLPGVIEYMQDLFAEDSLLNDYLWQNSFGQFQVTAQTFGWYLLPRVFDDYYAVAEDGSRSFQWGLLMQDCFNVAPTEQINYARLDGLNLVFSNRDFSAAGGRFSLSRGQGQPIQSFGVTILSDWARSDLSVVVHELGHAWGLPHQRDLRGNIYLSPWSVMSQGSYLPPDLPSEEFVHQRFGTIPQHFSALEKLALGWIKADQVISLSPSPAEQRRRALLIEEAARPNFPNSTLLLVFRTRSMGKETAYAVEVRQRVGFDRKLPPAARNPVALLYYVNETVAEPFTLLDSQHTQGLDLSQAFWQVGDKFSADAFDFCVSGQARQAGQSQFSLLFIQLGKNLVCPSKPFPELFVPVIELDN